MLKAKTPLLVGLMVVAGAATFIFTFGSLDEGVDTSKAYPVYALFDDATGLVPNSRVMMSGIEVGRLGEIALATDRPGLARVEVRLQPEVKLRKGVLDPDRGVWVNGAAAVRQQASLIGDYYVALSPGLAGPIILPGEEIPTAISESGLSSVIKNLEDATSAIFPKLERIADDIKSITGGLRETLGEEGAVADLKRIREDIAQTTENVAALSGELRGFLKESIYPRGEDIDTILGHVERATATIANASGRTTESIDRILNRLDATTADLGRFVSAQTAVGEDAAAGTIGRAIAALDKNMALLEDTLESVRTISTRVEQGQGTVGRLLSDDKLITDIERVIEDVSEVTSTIGRTQVKIQFRADRFFGRGAFKSTVDFSLHPRPDKFYLFQLIDDPSGKTTTTRRVTTTNDPRVPPVLVEDVHETTSDFKFTAQMAKRWELLTFRFGIMESSGGLGLDFDLLEETLNFRADLFEFGRDSSPRFRFLAQWEFISHIFLSAGIDDLFNSSSRDWFVGVGVRFTDADIKGILPFAPSP